MDGTTGASATMSCAGAPNRLFEHGLRLAPGRVFLQAAMVEVRMMSLQHVEHTDTADDERTLAGILHSIAETQPAARFYPLLQLGVPFAIQFGLLGWWRTASIMLAVGAFGVWGLCERHRQQLDSYGDEGIVHLIARLGSATVSATLVAGVVLESFLRLLGAAPIL